MKTKGFFLIFAVLSALQFPEARRSLPSRLSMLLAQEQPPNKALWPTGLIPRERSLDSFAIQTT
jgi:hypothetical protein